MRLQTAVSSNTSKAGAVVEAVSILPVLAGERVVLPAGILLKGTVVETKPSVKTDERAVLHLVFTDVGGVQAQTRVIDVDNAREATDETGKIIGILASETLAARIDQGIGKVAVKNEGLAAILEAAKVSVLNAPPSGEIKYEPGVELKLHLTQPLTWKQPVSGPRLSSIADEKGLIAVVNAQPFQTMAEKPRKPSDITNLMFIGSEEKLTAAFQAAGWTGAHAKNAASIMETVRAIAELRGYKEAPMSTLLLEDKRSDFDFQKQNNTFAKRHHLRIWRRPATFDGKPVWVSSATHDTGIEFSQENRTFIHTIDSQIDRERAKVVSDLLFTGQVESLALVDRPLTPKESRNATGDAIQTDGRMAVLVLK